MAPLATAACAAAVAALLAAEWRGRRRARAIAKLAASAAFLVVAAACADPAAPHARWLLAGLAWGAVGDALLLGRGAAPFLAGLVAFLLGHLAYAAAMAALVPADRWLAAAGAAAALPIAAGLAALAWLWPHAGRLRAPVIAYVAAIAAMVVGAIAVARAGALPDPQRAWLCAGAVLFFVSDLAVARQRFVARGLANALWGLPAYYAGQLLIAWSLA